MVYPRGISCSVMLTLADVVAAVSRLKGLGRAPGAAAKLHLWAVVSDTEHRAMSHVAATEAVGGNPPTAVTGWIARTLLNEYVFLKKNPEYI